VAKSVSYLGRLGACALGVLATLAFASEPSIPKLQREVLFHIERGPLESALIQFSLQAGIQVVLAPGSAGQLMASPVSGRLVAGAALTALLKGTGLSYSTVGDTVMVQTIRR
jgi:hypothetical protein